MNYKRIYSEFIADRKRKTVSGYAENHHIKPKSLGGGNEKENLIYLSAEDHMRAHLLLAKIHGGSQWAAVMITFSGNRKHRIPTKRMMKLMVMARENQPPPTDEIKKKISKTLMGRDASNNKGRKHSDESRRNMSKSHIGQKSWNKGVSMWTDDQKAEMSRNRMGNMTGALNPKARGVICVETGVFFDTVTKAANHIKGNTSCISAACKGKRQTVRGLHWKYA